MACFLLISFLTFFVCFSGCAVAAPNREAPASLGNIGVYTTKVSIGSPPTEFTAMVDITGRVNWVQCHNDKSPSFNPEGSTTYKHEACDSTGCKALDKQDCLGEGSWCIYVLGMPDGSEARGNFSRDVFNIPTISKGVASLPEVRIACGVQATSFMGGKPVRFAVALVRYAFQFKFSHCFPRRQSINDDADAGLLFGDDAKMLGNRTTPPATCTLSKTEQLYTVTLEDISVGFNNSLQLPPDTFVSRKKRCGVALKSTTAVTYLPRLALDRLVAKIMALTLKSSVIPQDDFWPLCYPGTRADLANDPAFNSVTLHFKGGLDVVLTPLDLFVPIDASTVCLLMSETDDVTVIGSYALQNKNIAYDFGNPNSQLHTVSVVPAAC